MTKEPSVGLVDSVANSSSPGLSSYVKAVRTGGALAKSRRRVVKELEAIVGRANVIYHPEDLLVFEYDGSIDRAMPQAVVFPDSTEEVSRVVKLAYREGLPVVARGSGTGLSGGSIAALGGHSDSADQNAAHPGGGCHQPSGRGGARCGESRPGPASPQIRPALRA